MMWNQDLHRKALHFAANAHKGQTIPGSEMPYIVHITLVAMEVIAALEGKENIDGDLAVQCALLHDTIEDTAITFEELQKEFGRKVATGVQALTKDKTLAKAEAMQDSLARISNQPKEIWMVKMADRITNLGPPPPYWNRNKICAYRDEAIVIHEKLEEASPFLSKRLSSKIDDYLQYADL